MKVKLCGYPGCNRLTENYFCEKHAKQKEAERKTHAFSSARRFANYNSPEWRRFSRAVIAERGCCELCGTNMYLQVHHIIPVRYAPELFLEHSNVQVLCRECHARQTANEIRQRKR